MRKQKLLRDYGLTVVIAVSVAIAIRSFILEAYRIPGSSMRPTLEAGDTIFVQKWKYRVTNTLPVRGEVVVFTEMEEPKRDFIKRVVGLPGERIELKRGRLTINGEPVAIQSNALEPLSKTCATEVLPGEGQPHGVCWEPPALEDVESVQVPENSVFVVGDMRMQSPTDLGKRRSWGNIPISSIKGNAAWIWMSIEPQSLNSWFPHFRFDRIWTKVK